MSHATAAQSQLQPSFWGSVWESLQGSHQDFTVGNLNRAILLLAIPMVLEMALESLFAVVDVFWVSHLGANAVATVGLTESLLTLVFAVALGLSLSTTAMVDRKSTRLNSSHLVISYAVFCLKKKKNERNCHLQAHF